MSYGLRGLGVSNVYPVVPAPSTSWWSRNFSLWDTSPDPNAGQHADVLVPDAAKGTAMDCGFFAGGVFFKDCWCLSFPSWCTPDNAVAAQLEAHPENIVAPKPPPVVAVPSAALPTPDAIIADQMTRWQGQNMGTIQETAANIQALTDVYDKALPGGLSMWVWAALGLGVFGFVALSAGGPRRYGR